MADSSAVSKTLKRPAQFRGLLHSQIKRNLAWTFVSVFVSGMYMKFIFGNGTKRNYAEFYKHYDIDAEFERMRKKGLFDSCDDSD